MAHASPSWSLICGLVGVTAVACIEPATTRCGPLICPVGLVCDEHRVTCVLPAQVAACGALVQGAACSYPDEPDGACDQGVCHTVVCGNALREPGEICDDGNAAAGDGCSAACDSLETCGNRVVDLVRSEACDDGGFRSHDGCSSACRVELPGWEVGGQGVVAHGSELPMAYDAGRRRLVRFGGFSPTREVRDDTIEWNGATRQWALRSPDHRPPRRHGHVLVYDATRRHIVVFGGADAANARLGDTWSYDGLDWTARTPVLAPSPRRGAAAAFDGGRRRVVLFGGDTAASLSAETWEYDGSNWIARAPAPATAPPPRRDHVMTYDAVRDRVVLFGGRDASGARLSDTWEWNGASWEARAAAPPNARGAMVWDATRAAVVMFGGDGGDDGAGGTPRDETWEYRGLDWIEVTPAASPPPRLGMALAYDAGRGRTVLFGGSFGVLGTDYQDTWEYDGAAWTQITPVVAPPSRNSAGFAYDPRRGHHVFFGGFTPPAALRTDTWTFDGDHWLRQSPAASPDGTTCPMGPCPNGMAYDPARARMVLVRQGPPGGTVETWAFDGGRWTRLAPPASPPSRWRGALVHDPARDRTVLFGGEVGIGQVVGDTWEFDGGTWTAVVGTAPPARSEAAMIWDPRRGRIVLFGGKVAPGQTLSDTWEFDGAWTQASPAASPPARQGAGIAFHDGRGQVVIFGGEAPPMPRTDVWEYDGARWAQIELAAGPPPRKSPHLAWDPVRQRVLLSGGDPQTDTWELAWRSVTPDERCDGGGDQDGDGLVGCADPDCAEVRCGPGRSVCRAGACVCAGGPSERACGDDFDDDCDGAVDCADGDCAADVICIAEAACGDGLDDDGDGRTDCADPGCAGVGVCEAHETRCGDAADHDADGAAECRAPHCVLTGGTAGTP